MPIGLTLERPRFHATENDEVRQLTHNIHKLQFLHLFSQKSFLRVVALNIIQKTQKIVNCQTLLEILPKNIHN